MARKVRLGVLVSGRGSNLQAIMDRCQAGKLDAEVAIVISNVATAQALERAQQAGISTACFPRTQFPTREARDAEILKALQQHHIDLVVLAGYLGILSTDLVAGFCSRILNIHPSLLPSFGGPDRHGLRVHEAALSHGVKVTGCTVQFVTEEVDAGPIIVQRAVPVMEDDTPDTLSARVLEQEHEAYSEAIQLFADGRLKVDGRRVRVLPPQ
jgi:phosphoribosylglycinamide formyltransferase-1